MTAHPAKFSDPILAEFRRGLDEHLDCGAMILDPFAGVGRIHELRPHFSTFGVELEREWAHESVYTIVADARDAHLIYSEPFDAIVTSPCYGNRMADSHDAKDGSKRHTYTHTLGRKLSDGNAGAMQWGPKYRELHEAVWRSASRVLKPGGLFVLNCKNHYRNHKLQQVTEWHLRTLMGLGFSVLDVRRINARGQRHGQNGSKRVPFETVAYLRKDA